MTYDLYSQHGLAREVFASELPGLVGLDQNDVDAAISEDGWCGCYCDVEPVVLVPHGDSQPESAEVREFLGCMVV